MVASNRDNYIRWATTAPLIAAATTTTTMATEQHADEEVVAATMTAFSVCWCVPKFLMYSNDLFYALWNVYIMCTRSIQPDSLVSSWFVCSGCFLSGNWRRIEHSQMVRNSFSCWLIHFVAIVVVSIWKHCNGCFLVVPEFRRFQRCRRFLLIMCVFSQQTCKNVEMSIFWWQHIKAYSY